MAFNLSVLREALNRAAAGTSAPDGWVPLHVVAAGADRNAGAYRRLRRMARNGTLELRKYRYHGHDRQFVNAEQLAEVLSGGGQ